MTYRELYDGLKPAIQNRYVNENFLRDGLAIYCYTHHCTADRAWDPYTSLARGLVLDHRDQRVAATPFPKFFNAFEREQTIPDEPFTVYDKIDGSLIILFWRDAWCATTKGAFNTIQAQQASRLLHDLDRLDRRTTYLLEYVGPENRIIIDYPVPRLYLLSGYWFDGKEFDHDTAELIADRMCWERPARRRFENFAKILEMKTSLPASMEGYVAQFDSGLRLKIKGDEYCRIHALVSRITPLGVWDVLTAGDDTNEVRAHVPEEFWNDFDGIAALLRKRMNALKTRVSEAADPLCHLSDKEVGLRIKEFPEDVRKFVFPYRHAGDRIGQWKLRQALHRAVRPTGNTLEGYVPSYMLSQVMEEAP